MYLFAPTPPCPHRRLANSIERSHDGLFPSLLVSSVGFVFAVFFSSDWCEFDPAPSDRKTCMLFHRWSSRRELRPRGASVKWRPESAIPVTNTRMRRHTPLVRKQNRNRPQSNTSESKKDCIIPNGLVQHVFSLLLSP